MVTRRVSGFSAHFKCQLMTKRRLGGSRSCGLEVVEVLPLKDAMSEAVPGLVNKAEDWGRGGVHASVNGSASGATPSPLALEVCGKCHDASCEHRFGSKVVELGIGGVRWRTYAAGALAALL